MTKRKIQDISEDCGLIESEIIIEDKKANSSIVSHVLDSSDDEQPEIHKRFKNEGYIPTLQEGYNVLSGDNLYPVSYILTDISNRLLLSDEVTEKYQKIKDPLQFRVNILKKRMFTNKNASIGVASFNANIKNNLDRIEILQNIQDERIQLLLTSEQKTLDVAKKDRTEWVKENFSEEEIQQNPEESLVYQVYQEYQDANKVIEHELETISALKKERDELNKTFKGAFPFIPKQLTPTFIEKYNKTLSVNLEDKNIIKNLIEIRDNLEKGKNLGDIDKLCELLGVKIEKTKKQEYKTATKKSVRTKLDNLIGRGSSNYDIKEYIRLNNQKLLQDTEFKLAQESKDKDSVITHIRDKINDCITKNAKDIYKILKESEKYFTNSDYLEKLGKQDFLVQVRAYKKLNRDIEKNILLSGDYGQRNVPPGLNTTVNITAGGSSSLFMGEFGSYSDIGVSNFETLKNYKNFILESKIQEKEKEFKSLLQIEAIRNSSALLTNAMFFELAESSFQPIRVVSGEEKYNFSDIDKQMPMAMQGAVSGSVHLEQGFEEKLTGKLPYDYREAGMEAGAKILDIRNKNILFDWLSNKIGVSEIQNELNNNKDKSDILKSLTVQDVDWDVTENNSKDCLILENKKTCYKITLQKQNEKFYLTEINSFPTKIFNELTTKWYGVELSYLEDKEPLTLILKAAAEPKNHDIDKDRDENVITETKNTKTSSIIDNSLDTLKKILKEDKKEENKDKNTELIEQAKAIGKKINQRSDNFPLPTTQKKKVLYRE